ncbi:MAG: hypothetical protein MI725_10270 [Pirellulales bacterium]|nr:hypothetical protein [Pirellulales bacterium]
MPVRCFIFACCLLPGAFACLPVAAHTFTIALTGNNAAGVTGAVFDVVDAGSLNANGEVAFTASLQTNVGGVTPDDNEGVWTFAAGSTTLLARTGVASAPDVESGSEFLAFHSAIVDNNGDTVLRAALDNVAAGTTEGLWRYSGGTGTLLARTGSLNVPNLPGTNFEELSTTPSLAVDGTLALRGKLEENGGVLNINDAGLWSYSGATGALVAREGISAVPDVPGAKFKNFGEPSVNSNNQTAWFATLDTQLSNKAGIWRYTGTNGDLLARTGVGNVPDIPGANFTLLRNAPVLNNSGQVVVTAQIDTAGLGGVWLYNNTTGSLLLQEAVGGVPGIPNAVVQSLDDPLLNNAGQVLVGAELTVGPGGVTNSDAQGLWFLQGGGSLVARSGTSVVPELPGAQFASFDTYAMNDAGQIALLASLQTGMGGVDSDNDQGLWLLDPQGESKLIARKGDTLAGLTIASLDFLADFRGASGFNNAGQLVFRATFADNNESGLFLFRPFAADFDNDGDVDTADLADWRTAFGQTADADADFDGDSDGSDFLTWQREFGGGTALLSVLTAVPEPAAFSLFLTGFWLLCDLRRRGRRP